MTSCLEEWRDIPGYEGRYQASNMGRIRSVDEFVRCGKGGKGSRLKKEGSFDPPGKKRIHTFVSSSVMEPPGCAFTIWWLLRLSDQDPAAPTSVILTATR